MVEGCWGEGGEETSTLDKLRPSLGDVGGIDESVSKDEVLFSRTDENVRTRRVRL